MKSINAVLWLDGSLNRKIGSLDRCWQSASMINLEYHSRRGPWAIGILPGRNNGAISRINDRGTRILLRTF